MLPQDALPASYQVRYSLSGQTELEGFRYKNVLSSYIHLHFRSNPALARSFVDAVRRAPGSEATRRQAH
jgi:cobyrinic acid a,c-diamide synthase